MPGHAQYTLGPVTCIDNVVDILLKLTMETPSEKRKGAIGLPAQVQLFRDSYTVKWPYIVPSECDDYAFCKVCDDSFSNAHGGEYQSRAHRGIEQTMKTNSSIR